MGSVIPHVTISRNSGSSYVRRLITLFQTPTYDMILIGPSIGRPGEKPKITLFFNSLGRADILLCERRWKISTAPVFYHFRFMSRTFDSKRLLVS